MAEKIFLKSFENYKGLDYRISPLVSSADSARSLQNMTRSEGYGIRGRFGNIGVGQPGGFQAIFNHSYKKANGANEIAQSFVETTELLALNSCLWKLSTGTITITRVGGSPTWDCSVSATGTGMQFVLTQGGSDILTITLNSGTNNVPITVRDLQQQIDALADFTCTATGSFAKVNGDQTVNVGANATVTAHSIASGTAVLACWDHNDFSVGATFNGLGPNGVQQLVPILWTRVGATSLIFTSGLTTQIKLKNGQVLGDQGTPAAFILPKVYSPAADVVTIPYEYWSLVPRKLFGSVSFFPPITDNAHSNYLKTGQIVPSLEASSNKLFIAGPSPTSDSFSSSGLLTGTARVAGDSPTAVLGVSNLGYTSQLTNLVKYNGFSILAAGLEACIYKQLPTNAGGAGVEAGTRKYKCNFILSDGAGFDITGEATPDATYTAAAASSVTFQTSAPNLPYIPGMGRVNGNQVGVSTITVFSNTFEIGERIFIASRATTPTTPIWGTVTAVTATTVTYSPDAGYSPTVSVNDLDVITNGMAVQIWRTRANSNVYYLLNEVIPFSFPFADPVAYVDTTGDASLLIQRIETPIGAEHDPPPVMTVISKHQGGLVGISPDGKLFKSRAGDVEYWSREDYEISIEAGDSGAITGAISDDSQRLIITKSDAIVALEGELDTNTFTVRILAENDYGVDAHSSLVRVKGAIWGVGKTGLIKIQNGLLLESEDAERINPAIKNNKTINTRYAVCGNDKSNHHFKVSIATNRSSLLGEIINPALFLYQHYEGTPIWFDGKLGGAPFAIAKGFATYQDTAYTIFTNFFDSIHGIVSREILQSESSDRANYDFGLPVEYIWWHDFEPISEPSLYKQFQSFKLFFYPSRYDDSFLSGGHFFSVNLRVYYNWDDINFDSYSMLLGDPLILGSSYSRAPILKLKNKKAKSISIKITSSSLSNYIPLFTGLEYVVSAPYIKEYQLP